MISNAGRSEQPLGAPRVMAVVIQRASAVFVTVWKPKHATRLIEFCANGEFVLSDGAER